MSEEFRKTAPAPLAPVAFNLAQPFETTLENGLKIVVFEDRKLPLVSLRLFFRSGDINEPADSVGLNSAVASMLSEGTENYSSRELAEEIERLGASLSASSGSDTTSVAASSLTLYSSDILRLMAEMVLRPTFPEEELDLYRRNTIDGLKFQRSQANFLAEEQMARIIFGAHPYSKVSPSAADVEKLTREQLVGHRTKTFVPNNAVMIVVGDVSRDDFIGEIKQHFGDWEPGEVSAATFEAPPTRSSRSITIVDRKGSAQANIVIANGAIERNHPDYFRAIVMNQVLGAGASSRIFMNIREDKGYTYGAYSKFDMRRLGGAFEATAEVRTDVTGPSLKEFFYEFERIRTDEVSQQELDDAKNYLAGVFPIRAETQEGLTGFIVQQQVYELPDDCLQTYRDQISAITIDDVSDAAEKYVLPDEMAIVIVGDAEGILPQVGEFASEVEVFDSEGNRLDVASFGSKPSAEVDITGEWELTIDFQGQKLPVTLTVTQTDGKVEGKLVSMLGEGTLQNGRVSGTELSAVAVTDMGGRSLELAITGSVTDDEMKGSLSAPVVPEPLEFTGRRK